MYYISDVDIENLQINNEIREYLEHISEKDINQKLLINFILFIFSSEYEKNRVNCRDWIKEIISSVENNLFTTKTLTPKLKRVTGINSIFNEFVQKINELNNIGEIHINDVYITYDMFNEYLDVLYEWFIENFEIN